MKRRLIVLIPFLASLAYAGTCPAGVPSGMTNCFFVSASGLDTNTGADEAHAWLHAPGMPNCSNTCGSNTPAPGRGYIFRGGDTWHFGNSGLAPYAGGTWDLHTLSFSAGNDATCIYEGTMAGCIYLGVDLTWFSGGSWSRPVLNADNPTSTLAVGSCAHQIPNTPPDVTNTLVSLARDFILDNFELTGLCASDASPTSGTDNTYVAYLGTGITGFGMIFETNLYIHGWTATATSGGGNNTVPITLIGGGAGGLQTIDHVVIDGSDSVPGIGGWGTFPSFYHFKDSIIRYATQGVGAWCHDVHDVIWEHMFNPTWPTHGNVFECNDDGFGNAVNQPQNTPNVFYNNIERHDDSGLAGGQPRWWFCPNTMAEYWFNNIMYDIVPGAEAWNIAGTLQYPECTGTGTQKMFNNTLVGVQQPCYEAGSSNNQGGLLTVLNEHLLNTPFDSSSSGHTTPCIGIADASNVTMTDAAALSQGYTTNLGITSGASENCANDATPCAPTLVTNSTVTAGGNHQAYCTTLAGFSSETAIGTDAANACKNGTTDGCTYNTSSHSMSCPAQTAIVRPLSAAWDVGAYQFSGTPPPPTALSPMFAGQFTTYGQGSSQ